MQIHIHTTVITRPFHSTGILRAIPGTIRIHPGRLTMSRGNGDREDITRALRREVVGVHDVYLPNMR